MQVRGGIGEAPEPRRGELVVGDLAAFEGLRQARAHLVTLQVGKERHQDAVTVPFLEAHVDQVDVEVDVVERTGRLLGKGQRYRKTSQVDNGLGRQQEIHADNSVDRKAVVHGAHLNLEILHRHLADSQSLHFFRVDEL